MVKFGIRSDSLYEEPLMLNQLFGIQKSEAYICVDKLWKLVELFVATSKSFSSIKRVDRAFDIILYFDNILQLFRIKGHYLFVIYQNAP